MSGRILPALRPASFDPDAGQRQSRRSRSDAVEDGAKAIYGVVTRTANPDDIDRKWSSAAKAKTRENHRAEAEAVIRAIGWRN